MTAPASPKRSRKCSREGGAAPLPEEFRGGHPRADATIAWDDAAAETASVQGLIALGPREGARVARHGSPPEEVGPITVGPCHARVGGFDLHAGIVVRAGERERLERLCRYTLRPPIAQKRLRVDADGYVWTRYGIHGPTARPICDSSPSRCWSAWRR